MRALSRKCLPVASYQPWEISWLLANPRTPMAHFHAVMAVMLYCSAANGQENPERILQQAIASHQAGQTERAISQYRAYLKLRPDSVDARSNLGVVLASTGRYREAIAEYREALKGRPQDPHIRLNLSLAMYKLGEISDAAASLSALHSAQPADRQVMLLLADCRSEEHTSELQSLRHLVCRLLL